MARTTIPHRHHCHRQGQAMKRRLTLSLLAAACAAAPLALRRPARPRPSQSSRPANDIVLSIGRGQLVTVPGTMADVFVANERSPTSRSSRSASSTSSARPAARPRSMPATLPGRSIWSANVRVGSNIDSVDQMLHLAMPDAKIAVIDHGHQHLPADRHGRRARRCRRSPAPGRGLRRRTDGQLSSAGCKHGNAAAGQPAGPLRRSQPLVWCATSAST